MASRSSPRLALWRRAVHLFHRYKRPVFEGPFYRLKLRYTVEPHMMTQGNEEKNPDIVASGPSGWCVLELTLDDGSKEPKLPGYAAIDPRYLGQYSLPPQEAPPNVMTGRLSFVNDGQFCQLILGDVLEVHKSEHLPAAQFREALEAANGVNLGSLPSLAITLLPEMKDPYEIREGVVDIVMQLFEPGAQGLTALDMVWKGLERLAKPVSVADHHQLAAKVGRELRSLCKAELKGYLEVVGDKFVATAAYREGPYYKVRGVISGKLAAWIGQPVAHRLEEFPETPPEKSKP